MIRRRQILPAALLLLLVSGGCGYFNSLYNANRRFADAERAARGGDHVSASREYRAAIERAAASYRKYPDGRWADDALLLLGRARFALGEYDATAAAMRTLLAQSGGSSVRLRGHAYLGAALAGLGEHGTAQMHLDSAALGFDGASDDGAFVRLWRARNAFALGDAAAGWADLGVAVLNERTAHEAALEGVGRATALRDSTHVFASLQDLADSRAAGRYTLQLDSLLHAIADDWSPSIAFHGSAPFAHARWTVDARDALALTRAEVGVAAGEIDAALELAHELARAVTGGVGSRARRLAGQIRLERATSVDELDAIRDLLRPAFDDRLALELMRRVHAAQILVQRGQDPASALSLFAAAEMMRDEIGAPLLARAAFTQFAAQQPTSVWAGKALLAAHEIAPSAETAAALAQHGDNAYIVAARGGPLPEGAIDRAEERLAWGIEGLRADAFTEAIQRDAVVGRAVAVLDSTRTAARADSVRIACGTLIDSLRIAGIRADSTRSACLRGDSARVAFVINADTVLLRDSTFLHRPVPVQPGKATPDTVQ